MALQLASLLDGDGWRCGIVTHVATQQRWLALQLMSLLGGDGWHYNSRRCSGVMARATTHVIARGRWLALWHCNSRRCLKAMASDVALQLASLLDGDGWRCGATTHVVAQ
jgi:hypothetical protein